MTSKPLGVPQAEPLSARPLWRGPLRLVRSLLIVYLLVILAMMFLERRLVFHPAPYPQGNWQPKDLAVEDAHFTAADGTQLHGWYLPCENPHCVILMASGNAGNMTVWADRMRLLRDSCRASVMVFDYRGYGRSQGQPDEAGILLDARAARDYLAQRAGVDQQQIVLIGCSLGGGVMVDLAAADGARALVLERTFSSLPDTAAHHYPWLPVKLLMRTRLDSLSKIANYQGPLLMSHGDIDEVVPLALGERLFAAANEPKQWLLTPGIGHNDAQPRWYFERLREFLSALP